MEECDRIFNGLVFTYQLFYQRAYRTSTYRFHVSERVEKQMYSFIDKLADHYALGSLGGDFFARYFIFQFTYWMKVEFEQGGDNGKVRPAYIMGQKSLKRWLNRERDYDWHILFSQFKKEYSISVSDVLALWQQPDENEEGKHRQYEDRIRSMFFNTDRGYYWCLKNTTLADPQSKWCITCQFNQSCRQVLKERYKKIYRIRYGEE